jgi:hypothetical protein
VTEPDTPIGIDGDPVLLVAGEPWIDTPLPHGFWRLVLAGLCPVCHAPLENVSRRTTVDGLPLNPDTQSWRLCRGCIVEVYQHLGRRCDRGVLFVWRQGAHLPGHV